MNPNWSGFTIPARVFLTATLLVLISSACRSGDTTRAGREPWTKQTRREVERDWWFQNRYDDSRPSALNPGEHP